MVAILFAVLGCDTTQPPPTVSLPPPTRLVSLNQPLPGERRRLTPPSQPALEMESGSMLRHSSRVDDPGAFDLSQYQLLGVVWGDGSPKALVSDPGGTSTILEVGSKLGRSDGEVKSISKEGVQIVEEYRAQNGEVVVLRHTLTLEANEP